MKTVTASLLGEIREYFTSPDRWNREDYYGQGSGSVECDIETFPGGIRIRLSKMYNDGIEKLATVANIQALSDIVGTDEIDIGDKDYRSGCSSCDWGSEESIVLTCYK